AFLVPLFKVVAPLVSLGRAAIVFDFAATRPVAGFRGIRRARSIGGKSSQIRVYCNSFLARQRALSVWVLCFLRSAKRGRSSPLGSPAARARTSHGSAAIQRCALSN